LGPWSKADPVVRGWAEANREALALYRQGAERPDALDPSLLADPQASQRITWALASFQGLALLEASRLEEQGDMAGACGWYRAVLRNIRHIGMHGLVVGRLVAQRAHDDLRKRVASWAADRRTSLALLRQAVDDVVACESLAPSESYTLKAEYLYIEGLLDGPHNPGRNAPPRWLISLASRGSLRWLGAFLSPEQSRSIAEAWRLWRREPERSRRVIRLATANWLAYYDLPPADRPQPDPDSPLSFEFYTFGPDAPANARALSPQALGRWLDSTHEAREILTAFRWSRLRITERANHRALVILLGTELYRRERGTDPPTPEALVGPYLKRLPSDDPYDETDATISRTGDTIE
jgi:hypothetical protein